MKPLIYFRNEEKFIKDNVIHTVSQMNKEANMVEVFRKGEFICWPIFNGKEFVKVQPFAY